MRRVELEQVRLDPVGEPRRELGLDVNAVGPLLGRESPVVLTRPIGDLIDDCEVR